MANIVPFTRVPRAIWSLHDLPSAASLASMRIACEAENRSPSTSELRDLRFAHRIERRMASASPLVLGISKHDCDIIRSDWRRSNIEYLPMSVSAETRFHERHQWMPAGKLRLLHLGRVSHLPSYRSLEFLLSSVLPLLDDATLQRIEVNVVGTLDRQSPRTERILALSERFPQVTFSGFVENLDPIYHASDAQVVASTEATGLRTRIVESFASYLPVLTTSVGVRGVAGIEHGRNLIIADTAKAFAQAIQQLCNSPEILTNISYEARRTYDAVHSRAVVAAMLKRFLKEYFLIE